MRVVVTGATGYVGRALVPHLARLGHAGIAVARKPASPLPAGWSYAERSEFLRGRESVDCVVHLEVKQHVLAPTEKDLREFDEVNVRGTVEWLDWCSRASVPGFLHFSSIKAVNTTHGAGPTDETAAGPGDTPYGRSKWEAEEAVRKWAAADRAKRAVIVRPAVIYGPENQANVSAMVSAIDKGRFFLPGGGNNVKSLVSIGNVAAAVAFLLPTNGGGCETYNLVDSKSYTVREFAIMVAHALGRDFSPVSLPASLLIIPALVGDLLARFGLRFPLTSSRLKALTEQTWFSGTKLERAGFVTPETTDFALRRLIDWYRANPPAKS